MNLDYQVIVILQSNYLVKLTHTLDLIYDLKQNNFLQAEHTAIFCDNKNASDYISLIALSEKKYVSTYQQSAFPYSVDCFVVCGSSSQYGADKVVEDFINNDQSLQKALNLRKRNGFPKHKIIPFGFMNNLSINDKNYKLYDMMDSFFKKHNLSYSELINDQT